MIDVVPYFQVHQPFRLKRYTWFDIGKDAEYFDDGENARIVKRVAKRCYAPMTALLLRAVERTKGRFRCAFSISGTALDQMERWAPKALAGFVRLAKTGAVEFLAETSHHSLAGLDRDREFERQVSAHAARIESLFGKRPTTVRNTELVLDNRIAKRAEAMGYTCILGEGADRVLGKRSPRRVYGIAGSRKIGVILRSYGLSDDIGFRFSSRDWGEWPLTVPKYAGWIHRLKDRDGVVGLFMDFETFGEHQWASTGIFEFMERLPEAILSNRRFGFATPAEAVLRHPHRGRLDLRRPVSWADAERDLTAWLGNDLQGQAREAWVEVGRDVRRAARAGRPGLLESWRRLSTSDHLYYMCTKWSSDGDVHKYFSPYRTPHDAFLTYMNVLDDLSTRANREVSGQTRNFTIRRTAGRRRQSARS